MVVDIASMLSVLVHEESIRPGFRGFTPSPVLCALWSSSICLLLTPQSTPDAQPVLLAPLACNFDSYGFTLRLHVAPPPNLPLSLLWESLVIAIGLNPAVAHQCEHGILCSWILSEQQACQCPATEVRNGSKMDREGGGGGGREGGREPPLVLELEGGRDGQECFGARWVECEICKPCSASCDLFLVPAGVPACEQGDRRLSGAGGLEEWPGAGATKCL
ncbi:hypothetical protein NQZ68_016597 [Dissostichus eleginoides]|nr:hypothetical protein NQZ68_016597 [Dissostichus eleginoides]